MRSAYDPDFARVQNARYCADMRAELEQREALRRNRFEDALAAIREPSTRSPEEVAELRARLDRLENRSDQPAVVELDE